MVFVRNFKGNIIEVDPDDFLNDVEEKGGKIYSVDSTTDVGLRVSGLGGIISLLRFPVTG